MSSIINMPSINDFQKDMTKFIHDQLQTNPDNIEKIIDTISNHDDQIKSLAKTILSIERCKMLNNINKK